MSTYVSRSTLVCISRSTPEQQTYSDLLTIQLAEAEQSTYSLLKQKGFYSVANPFEIQYQICAANTVCIKYTTLTKPLQWLLLWQ